MGGGGGHGVPVSVVVLLSLVHQTAITLTEEWCARQPPSPGPSLAGNGR
ncbi:hypothetical protein SFR_4843 [Streptomyces sp. FR-008]|nr:hypothetical protein SFR_4843 [Streptomyces sp. FR-008]